MRIACSAVLIAGAALLAGSSGSIAAPVNGGAIKAAADGIGVGESVHCRPFRHWHPWGYSRGCRGGVTIYEGGPRFRHRFGVREEFREGFRTRERAGVTIRGEERGGFRSGTREGTSVRGSTTFRGGGAGEVSPRGSAGGQTGTTTNATGGGNRQMNTAPTGAGGQNRSGAGGGNAPSGSQGFGSQQKQ